MILKIEDYENIFLEMDEEYFEIHKNSIGFEVKKDGKVIFEYTGYEE